MAEDCDMIITGEIDTFELTFSYMYDLSRDIQLREKVEQFRNLPKCFQEEILNIVTDETIFDTIFNNLEILAETHKLYIFDYYWLIKLFLKMYINYMRKSLSFEIINNASNYFHLINVRNFRSLTKIIGSGEYILLFSINYYKINEKYYAYYTVYYEQDIQNCKLFEIKLTCK